MNIGNGIEGLCSFMVMTADLKLPDEFDELVEGWVDVHPHLGRALHVRQPQLPRHLLGILGRNLERKARLMFLHSLCFIEDFHYAHYNYDT